MNQGTEKEGCISEIHDRVITWGEGGERWGEGGERWGEGVRTMGRGRRTMGRMGKSERWRGMEKQEEKKERKLECMRGVRGGGMIRRGKTEA